MLKSFSMTIAAQPPVSRPEISIEGSPVLAGRPLNTANVELLSLCSLDDCVTFAGKLRGQFSIVIRNGRSITAITDFGGTFPIYYIRRDKWIVSQNLPSLRSYCDGRISRNGLYFFAARNSVGIDPLYAGVKQALPGTVLRFDGEQIEQARYIDWFRMAEERPLNLDEAIEAFVESASSFLAGTLAGEEHVGCLLSGGTDSAIVAWLLKRLCPKVTCFTADYTIGRYSEYEAAHRNAGLLGLEHRRVVVRRRDHWPAFQAMNSAASDLPTSHSQLPSLIKVAEVARGLGIRYLVSGDNADTLLLGLESFFEGLPPDLPSYTRHTASVSAAEKLDRVVRWNPLNRRGQNILRALGEDIGGFDRWMEERRSADRELFAPFASRFPLWRFQQLATQYWGGVSYQNGWIPLERAVPGIKVVSPFLDSDIISLGLALPIDVKYRDGIRKFILYRLLERETGIQVQKRWSPNPSRIWSLFPDPSLFLRIDGRLKAPYLAMYSRNIARKGALHDAVANIAALGIWLRQHRMQAVED